MLSITKAQLNLPDTYKKGCIYDFVFQVISEKNTVKGFTSSLRDIFI